MMFYNGFNLMIDIILVTIAAVWFTRVGFRSGFIAGHEEGERWARSWESLGNDTDTYPKAAEMQDDGSVEWEPYPSDWASDYASSTEWTDSLKDK